MLPCFVNYILVLIQFGRLENDNKMLYNFLQYLTKLKIKNIQVLRHPRKTFALGFNTNINSIKIPSNRLLNVAHANIIIFLYLN